MTDSGKIEGTIRQLWSIASVLMLSSLSSMAMIFVDRMMLAKYSLEAHNAAIEAVNMGWAFQAGWSSLAGITQVFVSQYYGAGQKQMLCRPVWQMIWFCVCSFALFIPLAVWSPGILFESEMKQSYLFWMMLFVPFQGMFYALCGFFIGQKQMSLTVKAVFLGNILNFILAYLFIFGVNDFIPSLGTTGAIIATDIALLGQVIVLFSVFWKRSKQTQSIERVHYRLEPSLFNKCFQVGLPNALFQILETLGWSLFYTMMASLGHAHITVAGIVQNVLILSFFFADGLWKAVATLTGNAIGGLRSEIIPKIVRSAFILMTIFSVCLGLFLWLMRATISDWFLSELSMSEQALIYPALLFGLANAVIYKYLEGIRLSIGGALIAAADTKFLLYSGATSVWIFMVIPIYVFVVRRQGSIEEALLICSFYTLITALIFIWRFYNGKWLKNANLIENVPVITPVGLH
jgi:multidrug resistance protein, MATE family